MVSLSLKGATLSYGHLGWAGLKWCCLHYSLKKKKIGCISLNISRFLPSTFSAKISDSSPQISASDSCKLCRSASFGSTHLTPVLFTILFAFPRIRFLFNFILFWMLGIRYGLCTEHLNTDRGEAARFQKLPTTIKRQYNTILPNSSSLNWKEQTIVCFST